MARKLSDMGKPMWIRHVLVPGLTDGEDDLRQMAAFIQTLQTVERVEILPYHTLGLSKWQRLGIDYPLEGVPRRPKEQVAKAGGYSEGQMKIQRRFHSESAAFPLDGLDGKAGR